MDKPLISIIIPCYNIAPYVGRCLDSVLAQTYQNIEVICVNDGSKDDTAKVLDEYALKDNRIKAIHKENGGVSSARFAGLEQATGEWIGFIDGDDVIDKDMYERLMKNVTEGTDISHCGYKRILPNAQIDYIYNTGKKVSHDNRQACKELIEGAYIEPSLCTKLYKKTLFNGLIGWLDTSIKINEDLLMNFYLFCKARNSVYEDFCPYSYILRADSAAATFNEYKLLDPIRVFDVIEEEVKCDEELAGIVKNRRVYFLIGGATVGNRGQKKKIKPIRNQLRKRLRKELKSILKEKCYSKRHKFTALWACIWPASYTWVHAIYRKHHYKYKDCQREYKWL